MTRIWPSPRARGCVSAGSAHLLGTQRFSHRSLHTLEKCCLTARPIPPSCAVTCAKALQTNLRCFAVVRKSADKHSNSSHGLPAHLAPTRFSDTADCGLLTVTRHRSSLCDRKLSAACSSAPTDLRRRGSDCVRCFKHSRPCSRKLPPHSATSRPPTQVTSDGGGFCRTWS